MRPRVYAHTSLRAFYSNEIFLFILYIFTYFVVLYFYRIFVYLLRNEIRHIRLRFGLVSYERFNQLTVFGEYTRHEEMAMCRLMTSILVTKKWQHFAL